MTGDYYTAFIIEIESHLYRARAVNEKTEVLPLLSRTDEEGNHSLKTFARLKGGLQSLT